jgi:two-component system NtrC family sensor kinase
MQTTRQRLTLKLLLLLILPPLVCTFGIVAVSSNHRSTEMLAEADRELADHVTVLRTTLPRLAAQLDRGSLAELIEQLSQRERVHGIALYDRNCQAIARSQDLNRVASEIDTLVCDGQRARPEQHRAMRLGGNELLVRTEPISSQADVGAVAVTHELSVVRAIIDHGEQRMLMNGALIALCMAGVALLIARSLGGALGTLVQASERVAAGDLTVRVTPSNLLELGRLGLAFNHMTDGLAAAQRERLSGEARRRELERRLRHAQALRAIGQVAASLAHEIASPLSTIFAWSRLAAADSSLSSDFREQANVVSTQCERITRIVQRLLSVSRFPAGERVQVKLSDVAMEVAAFLRPECKVRGVTLHTEIEGDAPRVFGERDSCLQILINLCMNAIQAQPRGGLLTLSITATKKRLGPVECLGSQIEVRDAGPGVPAERRDTIFEPFYSTRGGGNGLGLAIVRDIVNELGGQIEVIDAKEGGACFRVFLPAMDGILVVEAPPGAAPAPAKSAA